MKRKHLVSEAVLRPASGGGRLWDCGEVCRTEMRSVDEWVEEAKKWYVLVTPAYELDGLVHGQSGARLYRLVDPWGTVSYHAVWEPDKEDGQ